MNIRKSTDELFKILKNQEIIKDYITENANEMIYGSFCIFGKFA